MSDDPNKREEDQGTKFAICDNSVFFWFPLIKSFYVWGKLDFKLIMKIGDLNFPLT